MSDSVFLHAQAQHKKILLKFLLFLFVNLEFNSLSVTWSSAVYKKLNMISVSSWNLFIALFVYGIFSNPLSTKFRILNTIKTINSAEPIFNLNEP